MNSLLSTNRYAGLWLALLFTLAMGLALVTGLFSGHDLPILGTCAIVAALSYSGLLMVLSILLVRERDERARRAGGDDNELHHDENL
jgi:hypothetical protein